MVSIVAIAQLKPFLNALKCLNTLGPRLKVASIQYTRFFNAFAISPECTASSITFVISSPEDTAINEIIIRIGKQVI